MRIQRLILFLTISFILLAGLKSHACDYCLLSQGMSPLQTTSGIGIRIDERYTILEDIYEGSDKIDNPGNEETHRTTQFTGFYAINPELTVMAVVPYVKRKHEEWHDEMGMMEFHKARASGIGDIVLMGRYTFYTRHELDRTTLIAGQFGIKFPSGDTEKKDDHGEYIDAHGQPGSGSTDVLLGLNLSHAVKRFTVVGNLLYSINNEGEVGDIDHEFGDWLSYDVTGIYRLYQQTSHGKTVSIALGIAGEWRDREISDGETVKDSGGNVLYLNTGIIFIPHPKWVAELNYKPAIHHNLKGEQLGEDYKATLSLTYLF